MRYAEELKYVKTLEDGDDDDEEGIPPEVLREWKDRLSAWSKLVVNIENHKELDNPFEPDVDGGT